MNNLQLEEAVRERKEELRGTIIELRQDLADAEQEADRLTAENKGLIACLKKDVKYKQAVELAKREHENNKLTEQNKLMREALEKAGDKLLDTPGINKYANADTECTRLNGALCEAFRLIEAALTATGEPK